MKTDEYIKMFDQDNAGKITWKELHQRICEAIKQCFVAFQVLYGEKAEANGRIGRQRGVYGVDIMITEDY